MFYTHTPQSSRRRTASPMAHVKVPGLQLFLALFPRLLDTLAIRHPPPSPLLNTPLGGLADPSRPYSMSSSYLPRPPAIGTIIDNGTLELVSVLGHGGYGVVYRAVDLRSPTVDGPTYAVKCLLHTPTRNAGRQRRLHMQEIALHQLASVHPNVVTLHRVIEEEDCTFIVMDFCPDGDLFGQILQKRRYLGRDDLIKHVFLQLLDAVNYCHSLGIYHRDLKPESTSNVKTRASADRRKSTAYRYGGPSPRPRSPLTLGRVPMNYCLPGMTQRRPYRR